VIIGLPSKGFPVEEETSCLDPISAPYPTPGNGSVSALATGANNERINAAIDTWTILLNIIYLLKT
jgi:hypothetical protein